MRRKKFKISIIALIILFAVFLLFLLVSWKMGFFDEKSHYYELKATFENISGLKKNPRFGLEVRRSAMLKKLSLHLMR